MPVPEFVTALREKAGHHLLPLVSSNAIVFSTHREIHNIEVLLTLHKQRRSWCVPGGICDPGEHPAATAVRECAEETGVTAIPFRLAAVTVSPRLTYSNGDQSIYTELWYHCRYVTGTAHVADSESESVRWVRLSALGSVPLAPNQRHAITCAAAGDACTLDLPCNTQQTAEVHLPENVRRSAHLP